MYKIGVFGGSFNPTHLGHINVATTIQKKLGMDKIHIIPTAQNPLKPLMEGPTPVQRLEMAHAAFDSYGEKFFVDDREIQRGGKSYTIDTIKELKTEYPSAELYLILGFDAFDRIGEWKDISQILEIANLIVVSRPGSDFPETNEDLPECIRRVAKAFEFNFLELTTGKEIQFVGIDDIEISGTELRKKIRAERSTEKLLPLSVESYIRDHHLYKAIGQKISDYEKLTRFCADFLNEKKAIAIRAYDLRNITAPAEYTIVGSGTSTRHASSLADNLIQAVKDEFGVYPLSLEGASEGRWVLVDYGTLIVHIFYDFARQEYKLEQLWSKATEIKL